MTGPDRRSRRHDLAALQQAGVPIWASNGRRGGYSLDASMTMPPLNFTRHEAAAPSWSGGSGYPSRSLPRGAGSVPDTVTRALADGRILHIGYRDRHGAASHRTIEPVGLMAIESRWYLVAWCRLRADHRAFRLDRIGTASTGAEPVLDRQPPDWDCDLPFRLRELAIETMR